MFQFWEINQMEQEFCQYLKWEVNIDADTLKEFEDIVQKVFTGPDLYPIFVFPTIPQLGTTIVKPCLTMVTNNSTFPDHFLNPRHLVKERISVTVQLEKVEVYEFCTEGLTKGDRDEGLRTVNTCHRTED